MSGPRNTWRLVSLVLVGLVSVALWRIARRDHGAGVGPDTREDRPAPAGLVIPEFPENGRVSSPAVSERDQAALAGESVAAAAADDLAPARDRGVIPGEFVLSFYDERDLATFLALARSRGLSVLDTWAWAHAVRIRLKDGAELDALLRESPFPVEQAPNYRVLVPGLPPRTVKKPEGDYVGFGAQALAWLGLAGRAESWGSGVTVAVLDTGIGTHPAVPASLVTRVDLGDDAVGGTDEGLHGTAVASLIVGNSAEIPGIAPGTELLSIKVLSADGVGDAFTLARGIVEAVDHGADIINLCLGTAGNSFILRDAVDYALNQGVAIVAATGNDAVDGVDYPARYEGVLAVSAVDAAARHLYFANRGDVDMAAPGLGVTAAWGEDAVTGFTGTSAAAPFVSGALAALLSLEPDLSPAEAAALLITYADDAGSPGDDDELGSGVLDLGRVLRRDEPGFYDIAAAVPYLAPVEPDEDFVVVVFGQNRGTEALAEVRLRADIGGILREAAFRDVAVGETVQESFVIGRLELRQSGAIPIRVEAEIPGVRDARPGNNVVSSVLHGVQAGGEAQP